MTRMVVILNLNVKKKDLVLKFVVTKYSLMNDSKRRQLRLAQVSEVSNTKVV